MNDAKFVLVHALISFVFLVLGLMALLLPENTYSSMMGRLWPVSKSRGRRQYQRRLVGLILALFGFFPLKSDLLSIYEPRLGGRLARVADRVGHGINPDWVPFLMGLLVVGAGSFVAMNPEPLVRWSQRTLFPKRQIDESALRTWRFVFRVTGALIIFSSSGLFKLWLRS